MKTISIQGIAALSLFVAAGLAGCGDADDEFDAAEEALTDMCPTVEREPNGREGTALRLSSSNDCNGHGSSQKGMLAGATDGDWHYYEAYDVFYCHVNPTVDLKTDDPNVRICQFFTCINGEETTVECPDGTSAETSPDGKKGCCGRAGAMKAYVDCEWTGTEDIDVFIRVDRTDRAETCVPYEFAYHY